MKESKLNQQETPTTMTYLRQRRVLINLLIMMVLWLSFSVNFWLINFLVNNFDNVYPSALASTLSDFLA